MLAHKEDTSDGLILLGMGNAFQDVLCTMLESAHLLRDLEREEIEILAQYAGGYGAKAGTRIFKEGERGSFMCIVVEGRVDIIKSGGKKISTIRPGKTMGEMSVIDGFPYSATAIAVEETKLVYITRANFEKLSDEHPKIAIHFFQQIAKLMSLRLRQTTGILCDYL